MKKTILHSRALPFLAIAFSLLMTGCAASGPAFKKADNVPADKAAIYVYRPTSLHGAVFTPSVSVAGGPEKDLKNGGYFVAFAEPGSVVVTIRNVGKKSLTINAEAGGSYYFRGGTVFMAGGYPALTQVQTEVAQPEIVVCKQTEVTP